MSYYGYLAHHGIKGQKWGHRNGPPYPLDASDHSAQEKRLNGGRYSQGVHQNRGGGGSSSSGGSGKRELTPEEKAERRKKILKRVAIGAGVTAAALGTAAAVGGGIYAAKHPETVKAALANLKDKHLTNKAIVKAKNSIWNNPNLSNEAKGKAVKALSKNSILREAYKERAAKNLVKGKARDKLNKIQKYREKTGRIKGDITSESARNDMINNPWKVAANAGKIKKAYGNKSQEFINGVVKEARLKDASDNYLGNAVANRKDSTGARGAWNNVKRVGKKVAAPITATSVALGTAGAVAGKINGGINSIAGLANNKYVKKAYNDYVNYDDRYYDDYYPEDSNKKKKNR